MKGFKLAVAIAAMVLFAQGAIFAQGANTIGLGKNAAGDSFLVDSKGMTLYYYAKDKDGESVCTGGCANSWPIFYAPTPSLQAPLKASDFGAITRADGSKQTTYMGWPLYYYKSDVKPGDLLGEGAGKVWYILKVPAYTVMLSNSKELGNYLVDGKGMTLYWFTQDSAGSGEGTGGRNANWPAFAPASFTVPSALNAADFKLITRGDGTRQASYKGYPLYYYVKDGKRGDLLGQELGKAWFVIDPAKFPVGGK